MSEVRQRANVTPQRPAPARRLSKHNYAPPRVSPLRDFFEKVIRRFHSCCKEVLPVRGRLPDRSLCRVANWKDTVLYQTCTYSLLLLYSHSCQHCHGHRLAMGISKTKAQHSVLLGNDVVPISSISNGNFLQSGGKTVLDGHSTLHLYRQSSRFNGRCRIHSHCITWYHSCR